MSMADLFYIIGNFFEITYDMKTLREHAHSFAKEECRKNAAQKRPANVLCTFFVLINCILRKGFLTENA